MLVRDNENEILNSVKKAIEDGRQIIFYARFKSIPVDTNVYRIKFQYDEDTDDYKIISRTFLQKDDKKVEIYSRPVLLEIMNKCISDNLTRLYNLLLDDLNKDFIRASQQMGIHFHLVTWEEMISEYLDEYVWVESKESDRADRAEINSLQDQVKELTDRLKQKDSYRLTTDTYVEIKSANPNDGESADQTTELYNAILGIFENKLLNERKNCKVVLDIHTTDALDNDLFISETLTTHTIEGYLHVGGFSFLKDSLTSNKATGIAISPFKFIQLKDTLSGVIAQIYYETMRFIFKLTSQKLDINVKVYIGPALYEHLITFDKNFNVKNELNDRRFE